MPDPVGSEDLDCIKPMKHRWEDRNKRVVVARTDVAVEKGVKIFLKVFLQGLQQMRLRG